MIKCTNNSSKTTPINIEKLRNQISQLQQDLTLQKQSIVSKIYGNRSFETTPIGRPEATSQGTVFGNRIKSRQEKQVDWNIYKKSNNIEKQESLQEKLKSLEQEKKQKIDDLYQGRQFTQNREFQRKKQEMMDEYDKRIKQAKIEMKSIQLLNSSSSSEDQAMKKKQLVSSFRKNSCNKEKQKVRFQGDFYVRFKTECGNKY